MDVHTHRREIAKSKSEPNAVPELGRWSVPEDRGWADAKVDGDTELRSRRCEQCAGVEPLVHTGGGSTKGDQASSVWMSCGLTEESLPGPTASFICATLCSHMAPIDFCFLIYILGERMQTSRIVKKIKVLSLNEITEGLMVLPGSMNSSYLCLLKIKGIILVGTLMSLGWNHIPNQNWRQAGDRYRLKTSLYLAPSEIQRSRIMES